MRVFKSTNFLLGIAVVILLIAIFVGAYRNDVFGVIKAQEGVDNLLKNIQRQSEELGNLIEELDGLSDQLQKGCSRCSEEVYNIFSTRKGSRVPGALDGLLKQRKDLGRQISQANQATKNLENLDGHLAAREWVLTQTQKNPREFSENLNKEINSLNSEIPNLTLKEQELSIRTDQAKETLSRLERISREPKVIKTADQQYRVLQHQLEEVHRELAYKEGVRGHLDNVKSSIKNKPPSITVTVAQRFSSNLDYYYKLSQGPIKDAEVQKINSKAMLSKCVAVLMVAQISVEIAEKIKKDLLKPAQYITIPEEVTSRVAEAMWMRDFLRVTESSEAAEQYHENVVQPLLSRIYVGYLLNYHYDLWDQPGGLAKQNRWLNGEIALRRNLILDPSQSPLKIQIFKFEIEFLEWAKRILNTSPYTA